MNKQYANAVTPLIVGVVIVYLVTGCGITNPPPGTAASNMVDVRATARAEALSTFTVSRAPAALEATRDARVLPTSTITQQTSTPEVVDEYPRPSEGAPVPDGAIARLGIGAILQAAFSPDSKYLAVGTSVGVYLYESNTMNLVWAKPATGPVAGLVWQPYGNIVVAWYEFRNEVVGYEAPSGLPILKFDHSGPIGGVAWSPDGKRLAVGWGGSSDYEFPSDRHIAPRLTVWRLEGLTQEFTSEVPFPELDPVSSGVGYRLLQSVVWSPDGNLIAGVTTAPFQYHQQSDFGDTVIVWDALTGNLLRYLPQSIVHRISFSPDSKTLVSWTTDSGSDAPRGSNSALLWETTTDALRFTLENTAYVYDAAWHPDGSELVTGDDAGQVTRWDAYTGKSLAAMQKPMFGMRSLSWSRNGQLIAASGWARLESKWFAQTVVWPAEGGDPLYEITEQEERTVAASFFSPDNQLLAVIGGRKLSIHDSTTGGLLSEIYGIDNIHYGGGYALSWSTGGKSISVAPAYFSGNPLSLAWNIETQGFENAILTNPDLLKFAASDASELRSPDGEWAAKVVIEPVGESYNREFKTVIVITEVDTGAEVTELAGPPAEHLYIAWSPDGAYLAVGGGNYPEFMGSPPIKGWAGNVVMIWDTDKWQSRTLLGHTGRITDLKFSPDNTYVATSSADGTVIIWQVAP
jgi:WD40 repeat protein